MTCFGIREGRLFKLKAALLTEMKARLLADLGQGDGAQQPPETFAIRQLKLAALGTAQERAASRLHHVLGTNAAPHSSPGRGARRLPPVPTPRPGPPRSISRQRTSPTRGTPR